MVYYFSFLTEKYIYDIKVFGIFIIANRKSTRDFPSLLFHVTIPTDFVL